VLFGVIASQLSVLAAEALAEAAILHTGQSRREEWLNWLLGIASLIMMAKPVLRLQCPRGKDDPKRPAFGPGQRP
jgi:hypothetical protein